MWFNLFSDTQRQMQELLQETRSYVGLQKEVLVLETRDKLSIILSHLAIAVVCLVLGGMVLLFFSFFLAYIIGQALGNVALGFACVTAFVILLLIVFWMKREAWVVRPINSLTASLFVVNDETLTSENATEKLRESRSRMSDSFGLLVNPSDKAEGTNAKSISNMVSRGFAIYEGLRLGLSIVRTMSSIFGRRKRRRR